MERASQHECKEIEADYILADRMANVYKYSQLSIPVRALTVNIEYSLIVMSYMLELKTKPIWNKKVEAVRFDFKAAIRTLAQMLTTGRIDSMSWRKDPAKTPKFDMDTIENENFTSTQYLEYIKDQITGMTVQERPDLSHNLVCTHSYATFEYDENDIEFVNALEDLDLTELYAYRCKDDPILTPTLRAMLNLEVGTTPVYTEQSKHRNTTMSKTIEVDVDGWGKLLANTRMLGRYINMRLNTSQHTVVMFVGHRVIFFKKKSKLPEHFVKNMITPYFRTNEPVYAGPIIVCKHRTYGIRLIIDGQLASINLNEQLKTKDVIQRTKYSAYLSDGMIFLHDLCDDIERDESRRIPKWHQNTEDSRESASVTLKLMAVNKNEGKIRPGLYKEFILGYSDGNHIEAVCVLKCGLTDANSIELSSAIETTSLNFHQPPNFNMNQFTAEQFLVQNINFKIVASSISVENAIWRIKTPRFKAITKDTAITKIELLKGYCNVDPK